MDSSVQSYYYILYHVIDFLQLKQLNINKEITNFQALSKTISYS